MNEAAVLSTMDSSLLSFVVLAIIYFNVYNRQEKVFLQYKLFIDLVRSNMAMLVIDILGWIFNGLPGMGNLAANTGFNLLLYLTEPIPLMLGFLYTNFQVLRDENQIERLKKRFVLLWFANAVPAVMSLQTGWFFFVDSQNIYHRGEYYWCHVAYCASLMVYSLGFILYNRNLLERRYFHSLLLFYAPQIIGSSIQNFKYGVSYNWSGMMVSLLVIFFNIQDRGLNTDYLTGLYNRRQLDNYMKAKIKKSAAGKSFSAILIDLNEFKQINDRLGHDAGDEALRDAVGIIKKCLRNDDFVARFGGDEFFVILDIHDRELLELTANRLREGADQFNVETSKEYEISFSLGYDVYEGWRELSPDAFFKHIDALMYADKKKRLE
ncbi:MAG TPA: GGDEF domain-containing protein [Patescibacteria group bacterium]|nr:GGDEF domain-containing protein [Patescibacteria group bacterium]